MITNNISPQLGIVNGATGIIKDIIFKEGDKPPSLPKFVLVDMGNEYQGTSFFKDDESRKKWVPIHPYTVQWSTVKRNQEFQQHSRTMLTFKLAWAWTVWKAQGQTIRGKLVLHLGKKERAHGFTYTAFSRATVFQNIGLFDGITKVRLCDKIRLQKQVEMRKHEEKRLRKICQNTLETFKTLTL